MTSHENTPIMILEDNVAESQTTHNNNFDPNYLLRQAYPQIPDKIKNERDKEGKKVLFTEKARSHIQGEVIFDALYRSGISALSSSGLPLETQEKYHKHYIQGELEYLDQWVNIEGTDLETRKQDLQQQFDAMSHVQPLTQEDVIVDFQNLQLDKNAS